MALDLPEVLAGATGRAGHCYLYDPVAAQVYSHKGNRKMQGGIKTWKMTQHWRRIAERYQPPDHNANAGDGRLSVGNVGRAQKRVGLLRTKK